MQSRVRVTHPPVNPSALKADQKDLDAYISFFRGVDKEAELSFDGATMADHNITLANMDRNPNSSQSSYFEPYVLCASVERGAAIITYHVFVGPFIVVVKMLNIEDRVNNISEALILGKGVFGSIVAQYDGKEQFVAKRVEFDKKLSLIKSPKDKLALDWVLTATY
jgi:hypothetical protein